MNLRLLKVCSFPVFYTTHKNSSSRGGGGLKTLLLLFLISLPLAAETAEHNSWFPSNPEFNIDNIYFGVDPRITLPISFADNAKFSGWGLGLGAEVGYDLSGWLFSLRYTHLIYGPGGMLHGFNHDMITLEASKLFTKYHIPFFPEWLDLRVKVGFGVDFSHGRYFKTAAAEKAKLTSETSFAAIMFSLGIFAEYTGLPLVTPYAGMNFDFSPDIQGLMFMPSISLGIRTSIGKVKLAFKKPEPEVKPEDDDKIFVYDDGETYRITLSNIVFDANAATFDHLTPYQKQTNDEVIEFVIGILKKFPDRKLTIRGYANSVTGTKGEFEEILVPLSLARAEAVKQILIDKGIDAERISAVGLGNVKTLETQSEFSWKNRRVEFILEK